MDDLELKISIKDWLYIVVIATLFGFFTGWFFYLLSPQLKSFVTIIFSTQTALIVSLYSSFFITISNNIILPKIDKKFWYLISFIFSFFSGTIGFLSSYIIAVIFHYFFAPYLFDFLISIMVVTGFLTFLIGLILHKFIAMKYRNEYIKNEILREKIRALENELNPHFLFNSLNSVIELLYKDQKKAEKAIIDISTFLRNAITKESLITINDELNMVNTYVNIENIRFQNHITIHTDIENPNILIPKFSIQLLVENAIKHGYKFQELHIEIKATNNKITILNDGIIAENLRFGVGLTNLQNRLKILNIGSLEYCIDNKKMKFCIMLKEKK